MFKKYLILLGFILALGHSAFAAPAPNSCDNPTNITYSTGVQSCVAGSNTGAAAGPDFNGNNCYDFTQETVWYEVTTTGSSATIDIALTSAILTNPYFTVFTTTDCLNYTIINCTQGSSGAATNTVSISTSTTYLIAVSDQNGLDGNFNLCITVNDDNSACNTNNVLTVTATSMGSPLAGPYQAGEIVSFCYTITNYQQINCNYLQGIVPTFGDCWDPVSFTAQGAPVSITTPLATASVLADCPPGPPCAWNACVGDPAGTWSWFPAGSATYNNINNPSIPNGTPIGAGWFFLTTYSPTTGSCTGDPTDPDNSYGDGSLNCGENTYDWTVCFQLQTRTDGVTTCFNGLTDCSVSIKTYADGEIGVWDNVGCLADISSASPSTIYACCAPTPAVYNVSGGGTLCNGEPGVSINLSDSENGVTYELYLNDVATGTTVSGTGSAISFNNQTLAGTYTVIAVIDATGCGDLMTGSATITVSGTAPTVTVNPASSAICSGESVNLTATVTPNPATIPVTFSNTNDFAIPDNDQVTGISSTIVISGVTPTTVATNPIVRVCLNIDHTRVDNLDISLMCPGGTSINLSSDNGGAGDNYTGTCFVSSGTAITVGAAPFTGDYVPEQAFTGLNACNINGTWTLRVFDDAGNGSTGTLLDWSIDFNSPNTTTYTWSPTTDMTGSGTLTPTVTPTSTTAYTITATDQTGCSASATSNITVSPGITLSTTQTDVLCFGNSTGAVNLTVNGGTSPFTYIWTGGATTQDLSGVVAGTYSVTVTDALSCTNTTTVTLTQPASPLTASLTGSNVNCFGDATGSATLVRGGGTPPYTYAWSSGQTTQNLSGIVAGNYTVTVTDANFCTITASVTITEPVADLSTSVSGIDADCFGANTGSASTTTTGGTSPYTYIWDDPLFQTTANATNLIQGTYNVTVTDANLCTTTGSVFINEPAQINLTSVITNSNCGSNDGAVNLSVSGGASPYSYSWTGPSSFTASTQDINTLYAGTYNVTLTDANNCTATHTANVTDAGAPTATITGSTNVSCNGGNDATATVTISGILNPPYDYVWSTATNSINDPLTTNTETGLSAGTVSVTITDNNNCQANASVSISEPSLLNLSITSQTNVSCNTGTDGSATVSVSGGTAGYTYLWNDPANQITATVSALSSGIYTVTVMDTKSCTSTTSVTITEPAMLTVTSTEVNVSCNNICDASLTANPSGGTSPYTYLWNDGAAQNYQTAINLCDGIYNVTVTDNENCTETITVTITEPVVLSASIVGTMPSCNGSSDGIANLSVVGGTSPYTYIWSTTATTEDINGLVAGTYDVTITDINNCQTTTSATISEPTVLNSSISASNVSCYGNNDGATDLTVSGGTTPYSFVWSNFGITEDISSLIAAPFYVTITDSKGCIKIDSVVITEPVALSASILGTNLSCNLSNDGVADLTVNGGTFPYTYLWSNAETIEDISNLSIGNYDVTVTDNNGCQTTASVTLTEPAVLTANIVGNNVSCNGFSDGAADLTISGGTTPYSILWSNSALTEDISGLTAGNYEVTVTDANSCTSTASVSINEPAIVNADAGANDAICIGETISLTASGGNSYVWSNSEITATINVNPVTDTTFYVTVTDAIGCSGIDSVEITVNLLPNADAGVDVAFCEGSSATLTATGGVSYLWSNSAGNTATVVVQPTSPQYYFVTVTDINGCSKYDSTFVMYNPLPNANAGNDLSICYGNDTVLTASGGTFFLWNTSETTSSIIVNPLSDATYFVTVSDVNGCFDVDAVNVAVNSLPIADAGLNDAICNGENTTLTATGGSGYLWSTSEITQSITVNPSADSTYSVTVTDNNGCIDTDDVTITVNSVPTPSVIGSLTYCTGGYATLNTENYSNYIWSNGDINQSITADVLDNPISVTVTDANGCVGISSPVNLTSSSSFSPVITGNLNYCAGGSTVLNAGIFPFYQWSNGATTQTINATIANNPISVTVSDASGCTGVSPSVNVIENANPNPVISGNLSYCAGGKTTLSVGAFDSYLWSNNATTPTITVTSGTYTVSVTNGSNCSALATPVTVVENPIPTPVISGNLTYCEGNSALLDAGSFSTYTWTTGETTQTINATTADNPISVLVTNTFGCSALATSVNVNESLNPLPNITGSVTYCVGNYAVLNVASFNSYTWSTGATTQSINATEADNPISVIVSNADGCLGYDTVSVTEATSLSLVITGNLSYCEGLNTTLDVGSYTNYAWSNGANTQTIIATVLDNPVSVTVSDSFGCSGETSVTIIENANPTPEITGDTTFCSGENTILTTSASYLNYLWSNTSVNDSINISPINNTSVAITVTDANNCSGIDSVQITVHSLPVAYAGLDTIICYGGSIGLTAIGGTSFVWSTSETSSSITVSPTTTTIFYVTVTSANGCSDNDEVVVNVNTQLSASVQATNVDCNGNNTGLANLTVSGGTSPYTYLWSNSASNEDLNGVIAGNYSVTVTDSEGCKIFSSASITEPSVLSVTFSNIINAICSGNTGSATANATGGVTPYSYLWDSNSGNQTTATASSLGGGAHQITVTDANACSVINSVNIISTNGGTASISSFTNNICFGQNTGSATATMTGGTSPYSYLWSGGETSDVITKLTAGVYTVTITDANNCQSSVAVTITEPSDIILSLSKTDVGCYGGNDGSASVSATGGTSPYTYLWNDASTQTTATASNLIATGFTVTVTDANGCIKTSDTTIISPELLIVTENHQNVKCKGYNNGSIALTVNGGTSPYIYTWSNGGNSSTAINLVANTYSVTVTDSHSCSNVKQITITEPAADLQVNVTAVDADCYNGNNGEATVNATSGLSPYTYLWSSNGQTTQTATGLIAGVYYTVTVTDANTCNSIAIVNIGSPTQIELVDSTTIITKTSCQGSIDGKIVVNYSGGTPPYTYYWNNSKTDNDITELASGNYILIVTDFNNCEMVDTFFVDSEPVTCLDIPTAFTPNGDSYNDTWEIKYLYLYPQASIKVFNRWGQLVFECKDGCEPWDGTHNGKPLAFGPFTFILDLNDGTDPITGVVTLLK